MSRTFAYMRITEQGAPDQDEVRKVFAGQRVFARNIYVDSGGEMTRFAEMSAKLNAGDLVLIDSMMSLGVNNMEIAKNWGELRNKRHANIKVLDMELMDTRLKGEDAQDAFVADLAMQIFASVSKGTDKLRKKRQADGILAAKQKGVKFGITRKELPEEFEHYKQLYLNAEITGRKAAEALGMSASTFHYRVKH